MDIRTSKILKIISYILLPIFVLIMAISIFHLAFLDEYGNTESTKFIDTEMFANNYLYYIIDSVGNVYNQEQDGADRFLQLEDALGNKINYLDRDYMYSYYNGINEYVDFIIINKNTKEIFTNMRINDYNNEIQNIKNSTRYWVSIDGNIDTNIEYINKDNIKYNSQYLYSELENSGYSVSNKITDYKIYSRYNENKTRGTYKL